jgi:hypothetical protein
LISSFGKGIMTGFAAVGAALTELWSNGETEGQITKLRLVKRQRYGRGGALAHGGEAEIGAVGDESGEQRAVVVATRPRLIAGKRLECLAEAEATPFIDILQKFSILTRV